MPSHLQPQFSLRDGVLFKKGCIYLSATYPLLPAILSVHHSSPAGGHFGYHKTLSRIAANFTWPHIWTTVKNFIRTCDVCQRCKSECLRPTSLLQPLPIPEKIWTDISMDFVEGLPPSHGFTVVMVVIDSLTKYAHFTPMKHPFTASTVAKAFLDQVFWLHGMPASIISDRDKIFINSFWKTLF